MPLKYELQNIISRNGFVRNGEVIQTITDYLRAEKKAVSNFKEGKLSKVKETEVLKRFIVKSNLWYLAIDDSNYIGEGAEQKIYEFSDPNFVLKLNNSIFYAFWEDLNNLLIHNYFFSHLAYKLFGFLEKDNKLFAVVKQPFVRATENTDIKNAKDFLTANGFINKKDNDYFHPVLGIILEDLYDENVLMINK